MQYALHSIHMNDDMLQQAYERFDAANAEDPNQIIVAGIERPKELVFAERLTEEVITLKPDASLELQLAARCQHICRWEVPRNTQPLGRTGYLKWREGLKKHHAQKAGEILRNINCPEETISQVQSLNLKKNLKTDPDCQTLEDALCIVFLKYQFDELIETTEHEKMVRIVQKTWSKMSPHGHDAAHKITYSKAAQTILSEALAQ